MACCAFALFIVSQLLVPVVWLRERLFGQRKRMPDAAAAWTRPESSAVVGVLEPARRRLSPRLRTGLFAFIGLELVVGAILLESHLQHDAAHGLAGERAGPLSGALASADSTGPLYQAGLFVAALEASWCRARPNGD